MANYLVPTSDAENRQLSSSSVQKDDFNTTIVRPCKFVVLWNPTSIERNYFVKKMEKCMALQMFPTDGIKLMM